MADEFERIEELLAQGADRRAWRALDRVRKDALGSRDIAQLLRIREFALGRGDRRSGITRVRDIASAAEQNVRFLTRAEAIARDQEWVDPFPIRPPAATTTEPPPSHPRALSAVAVVVSKTDRRRRHMLVAALLVLAVAALVGLVVGLRVPARVAHWWSCWYQAESGGQPAWSPDGQLIAFRRGRSIWLVHPDGTGLRQLTRGACDGDAHPSWDPNGRRLVFSHGDRIWVMNADGSGRHLVTGHGEGPVWSPDGKWVTFVTGGDLYVVRPDGRGRRMISTGGAVASTASWAPDSRHIVFAGHGDLHVVSRNARGQEYAFFLALNHVGVGDAAWSPNGRLITFFAPDGIEIIDPASGKTHTLVHRDTNSYDPSWSPDGKRIAFYEYGGGIFIVNRDGSGLRKIAGA